MSILEGIQKTGPALTGPVILPARYLGQGQALDANPTIIVLS
jgi:hypothetical protein